MSSDPLVHVGYHKTGSTWMQQYLFRKPNGFCDCVDRDLIRYSIIYPGPLEFNAESARQKFDNYLQQAKEQRRVPVISEERLIGGPHSGGYDTRQIAERLKCLFPEAKILLMFREQRAMILSVYKQYVRVGGACSFYRYIYPPPPERVPNFRFEHFCYDRRIRLYQELFGRERVLALPFELFIHSANDFIERVAKFCGISIPEDVPVDKTAHPSLSSLATGLKRHVNRLFVRDTVNPAPVIRIPNSLIESIFLGLDRVLPTRISEKIDTRRKKLLEREFQEEYIASNRETEKLTGFSLGEYGYVL